MYLFRPLADSVELLFQSSHCCCSISSTTEDGTKDEERGLLSNSHHTTNNNNNTNNTNNYVLEDDVLDDDDDGIFEEVSVGYRLFNCSKGCAGYAGRVVGTALSVMMALLFMGGIAVVIAHSLNELEQGGKMDNYRKQYSLLENRTARYFTQNFHIDGDKFVTQVWGGSDGIGTVSVALLGFMTNFASALLLVLVFLTFMLVDDQYNEGPRSRWEKNNNQNNNQNKNNHKGNKKNVLKKMKTTDFEDTLEKEEKEEVLVEELSCVERVYWYVCCCYQDDKTDLVNLQTNEYIGIRQAINSSIMQYIVLKTKICVFASILVFFMLTILSIPLAGLIAITSFVLNYIPNFGPAVATLLPIPVVLLDADLSSAQGVLAILLPALVHGLVGNLLEPVLFKANKEIDLHPVVLIGCIVFWYILWGVPGAILAVPLTTTIKIISEKIEEGSRLRGEESNGAWAMKEILNGGIPFHDDVQE
jgi:predicted PurR-regulated permease PerM